MLQNLALQKFTVFADATFEFGGLNVLHGENSSGKTHILNLAYSIISLLARRPNEPGPDSPTKAWFEPAMAAKLVGVFRPDEGAVGRLVRRARGEVTARVTCELVGGGVTTFQFRRRSKSNVQAESLPEHRLEQQPVMIPTRELLSVYPGFVNLYATQAIPFDETWRDTCLLLGAPVSRGARKAEIAQLLGPLESALGCRTELKDGRFYLNMTEPNGRVEADLVAEGFRKLSMVARLIANGSLDDKGYLFWDEPEANLNPRLVKSLAPLLLDLAAGGVQIFVATHSLFLMRELELEQVRRKDLAVRTRFFGLHPGPDGVNVAQGDCLDASGDIAALDESLLQADRYLKHVIGEGSAS